jgi:lipopolysaccharide export system protein LptA
MIKAVSSIIALFFALTCVGSAFAQSAPVGFDPDKPTEIDAERAERRPGGEEWVGEGSVRISQPGVVLTADRMVVKIDSNTNEIRGVEATGRVRYANVNGDAIAGNRARYDAAKQTLVVSGEVVLLQGPQVATADELTYNTVTGAMVMSNRPGGRVRGLFSQGAGV